MPAVPEAAIPLFLRAAGYGRKWRDAGRAERHLADRTVRPQAFGPPRRLQRRVTVTVARDRGWPVYTLTPRAASPAGTAIYAHGGGWVDEITSQHWDLCARIAAEASTTVIVPIYPLIPFGTAAEVIERFTELAAARAAEGPLVLAGDSAGGQISLSTALALRDAHGVIAARTVLISPGLDLTLSNPAMDAVQPNDVWLAKPGIRVFGERWRGELPLEDPRVSPLFGEMGGLGPVSVFIGTHDILWPDVKRLRDKLIAAGVSVEYEERAGLLHVYPLLPTASGAEARARIVAQIAAAVRPGP
jgi:acetyl esterase/lipase